MNTNISISDNGTHIDHGTIYLNSPFLTAPGGVAPHDVKIPAQILRLTLELRREFGTAIIYAGSKVEETPVARLFAQPQHPYTVGLLGSVPKVDRTGLHRREHLSEMAGMVPALDHEITGCRLAPRCRIATDLCRREDPPLEMKQPGHFAACWHAARAREAADV